ncbi:MULTISPECIES: SufE family protein [unclassified Fibrobacter]|uniref:SufE family protein n=1 Tax=unclassified Fibrobacter TaxID=2634177 RepID=UPI000D6C888A|nr:MULTISPECIES: SufE family protein [unclassified Fibrobacter]PWJ68233.1 cysteine desulfuration protein SufE [Fibrobacter sp. UWR4]PZW72591.1 cysteine desulfuration protein SufE [Fibrobacter sp. UWR1]
MSEVIEKRLEEVRAKFAGFTDPDDKWNFLIGLAKEHKGMDPALKNEKFVVVGCAATMYLVPQFTGSTIHFEMDVEGGATNPLISRGLGALALSIYNDMLPSDILSVDPKFFQDIGLNVGLSPTRSNGFASLLKQIYLYARVYDAISKK